MLTEDCAKGNGWPSADIGDPLICDNEISSPHRAAVSFTVGPPLSAEDRGGREMEQLFGEIPNQYGVVCLCGSAGGLEAYRTIFRNLTAATGMAFVVLAHRGPENSTLLPLLTSVTDMPVSEVEEGMPLEPNHVFLMPARVHMTTTGRTFHLGPRAQRPGWPISISTFLISLAASVGSRAVAVILSGMAADGSSALRAIKAGGGTTFAQSGAEYDSMPQHAIKTGHVDFVLSAAEIGTRLSMMASLRHMSLPWAL
jgi:two-component system CheB/CheR fusion protein